MKLFMSVLFALVMSLCAQAQSTPTPITPPTLAIDPATPVSHVIAGGSTDTMFTYVKAVNISSSAVPISSLTICSRNDLAYRYVQNVRVRQVLSSSSTSASMSAPLGIVPSLTSTVDG